MSKKILIVDDEGDIREAIADVLSQAGFVVSQAENGEHGLNTALSEHPDLILLDVTMPIMNGQEMLTKLREDAWGKTVKVAMLTSMDDTKNVAQAYSGNVSDYLVKSQIDIDAFVKQIKQLI
ncbi:MAG: response regulator [Candidatus Paceibacteria bacterium]